MESIMVEQRYLYVNKRCGTVSGVWPYGNSRLKWIARFTMLFVAISSIITQIARIVTYLSVSTIIEQCPFLAIAFGLIVKEFNYIIHEEQLRMVFESIYKDWMANRPKGELGIMKKYARRGLFFCNLYVANGCFCYVIFTLVAVTPRVLDLIAPRNESRDVGFIYPAYYNLDEEEHYCLIMAHMLSVITVVFFVYISCDSIYMTIVQHACALLNISGKRVIESFNSYSQFRNHCLNCLMQRVNIRDINFESTRKYAMVPSTSLQIRRHQFMQAIRGTVSYDKEKYPKIMHEMYEKVRSSVVAHQHAMDYITNVERMHETYLFVIVAMIMLSFCITLVKTSMMDPCVEFYKYCGFLLVQLVHLLFLSIQGHFIIVSNDKVYNDIYEGLWYNSAPKTQILYALALRRNLTPPVLTAGGLMTLNLKNFAEILKVSVSYFTVLKAA